MNKIVLMGRITKSVELRYTSNNNTAVCSFTLAVNRRFKKDGETNADFINCQAWGKTAEFISSKFSKGNMIGVIGRIQTRTWDDNEGKKHYATEVVVEETYFTGEKNNINTNADNVNNSFDNKELDGFYQVDDQNLPF